ncbi:MAG TPA: PVC-type heme-binding CxxCH protein, partial [Candidatus Limnocylindria bacterium]|nr:PVC-type heme-binding CxxCH protein [Candidatus Limnocylindria bacterium]
MRVAPEFAVDLVAAEPLVVDPVAIDWGADGKLWVVEMRDYPMGMDGNWQPGGVVKFLEDTNGDGRYDKATEFLENLPYPTGVFAWRKGVLVCAAPDILYAEDTNSDGRADVVRKVFTGFATNNYQARVNSLSLGLDNWIYGANGLLGGKIHFVGGASSTSPQLVGDSRISSLQGELDIRGRDFRINPDTGAFEPASGLTQQGRVRDDFGNWFGCDNSHLLWHYPLGDEYVRRNPHVSAPNAAVPVIKGPDWNRLFPASKTLERFNDAGHVNRTTSACGLEIYRDELLGKEFYGNAFTCEAVHNLVHREVLAPEGVTFRSARATNELDHEFLASTDNWFRPVQARTGPDGALWVVDMYRYVIEHPRWIPSNRLAQLDVRAGDDKGRIYRVYRKDIPPRSPQNFAKLSTRELVAALDSPNGTARDTVHRELLNRGDKSAARKLAALAMKSERPAVRVQALSVLNGLGELGVDQLAAGLSDKDERVREFATRVAGTAANRNERVVQRLLDQVSNFDARLQFQSVLTLGGLDDPRAVQAVEKFLPDALTNAWMRAAVMSGATGHSIDLFSAALKLPESKDRDVLVDGLIATAVGEKHVKEIAGLVVPALRADASVWRLRATQRLYEAADKQSAGKNGKPPDSGNASQDIGLPTRRLAELCRDIIADNAAPESLRLEAVKLFASTLATAADAEFLQRTLEPGPRQGVAVTAVLRNDEEFIGGMVLRSWKNFSPTQREAILSALVTRPAWTSSLLTALEEKAIASAEVPALVRTRLLDPKSVTRERAEKLWSPRASDRAKLIADYSKALKPGNVKSGATVFEQMCANCHTLNGLGNAVGPDIAPLRDKSAEDFLVAILDPNAAIEPRYVNYTVEGKNGTTFSGVIRSET